MKRKRKIVLHLVLILLSVGFLQALSGIPSLTAQIAFRREERQQLVGPAEILDTLMIHQWYDRSMVGKSEYGYSIFRWNSNNSYDTGYLTYYPKEENLTIIRPDVHDGLWNREGWQVPFLVFTEHRTAVKATMHLTLSYDGKQDLIMMEAEKQKNCYFLFLLSQENLNQEALFAMQLAMSPTYTSENTVVATFTLYDRNGMEIEGKTMDFTRNCSEP